MAVRLLQYTTRRKSSRKKASACAAHTVNAVAGGKADGEAAEKKVVLVGTYRAGQLERWPGYYNYPLNAGDAVDAGAAKRVDEIWLFNGAKDGRYFAAEFVGTFTRGELVRDWGYPAKGAAHGEKYLLYRIQPAYALANTPDALAAEVERVIVRAADFAKRSPKIACAIKAYLESSDRNAPGLANRLPSILLQVPRAALCVCEPGVQMEFVFLYEKSENMGSVKKTTNEDLPIISLFSGAGGLDIGFDQAGFRTAVMVELDPACCRTLRKNMPSVPVLEGDINQIKTERILSAAGLKPLDAALVIGGPPCQSFSLAGRRMGLDDPRGRLVLEFIRVVREALPKAFVIENVRGLTNWEKGKALDAIMTEAQIPIPFGGKSYSYRVCHKILNAADYGAPQFRERVFIVGNRIDHEFVFPPKQYGLKGNDEGLKPYKTVRDAICRLPPATPPSEVALRVSGTIKARIEKHGY